MNIHNKFPKTANLVTKLKLNLELAFSTIFHVMSTYKIYNMLEVGLKYFESHKGCLNLSIVPVYPTGMGIYKIKNVNYISWVSWFILLILCPSVHYRQELSYVYKYKGIIKLELL